MIEKIIHKNKIFALIVRGRYRNKKGITFFTNNKDIKTSNDNAWLNTNY